MRDSRAGIRGVITILAVVGLVVVMATPSFGLSFTVNDLGGFGAGTDQRAALDTAISWWTSILYDPVTVRLDMSYTSLAGSGNIAEASQNFVSKSVYDVSHAMFDDRTSADDFVAVDGLPVYLYSSPTGAHIRFWTNSTETGDPYWDFYDSEIPPEPTSNNTWLDVPSANLKALGLLTDDGVTADATISLNTDLGGDFDWDPSDGITAGFINAVGVLAHEIGHALGFTSGVKDVDRHMPGGPAHVDDLGYDALNGIPVFSVLDLFRYSALSTYGTYTDLDLRVMAPVDEETDAWNAPYFSIDSGTTNLGLFSTGTYNGDGVQAGHWYSAFDYSTLLGLMSVGTRSELAALEITPLDIRAFDVIGWDLFADEGPRVPEPSTFVLLGSALVLGGWRLRRRNRRP